MNVLDVLHSHGFEMKRQASTGGGEYAGPCPKCGGRDRFRVWPAGRGTGGNVWCRRCPLRGDMLTLLMELRGLSFPEACRELGVTSSLTRTTPRGRREQVFRNQKNRSPWAPNERRDVPEQWRERATRYVLECFERMMQSQEGRAFAAQRGLKVETLERFKVGCNDRDRFEAREAWGLEPGRKIWLPRGLVLPGWRDGEVRRIKTRRPSAEDGRPKYVAVSGGETGPLALDAESGKPVLVVEAEIDGLLCSQEAGDLVCTLALGAAQIRPDRDSWELIQAAPRVLCALDYDEAGAREWRGWWSKHVKHAVRWPTPEGKDPGEYMAKGGDLREWIQVGIEDLSTQSVEETSGNDSEVRRGDHEQAGGGEDQPSPGDCPAH